VSVRRGAGLALFGWCVLGLQLAGCAAPTDRPLLWIIQGPRPSYLYGTIHIPDARVLALPEIATKSLNSADVFCGEVPLGAATDQAVQARMDLPEGQTLYDLLPPELCQRTDRYLRSKGLSLRPLAGKQIWVVTSMLEVLDFMWDLLLRPPLDVKLHDLAKLHGKELLGLETVEEQMAIFETMTAEEQIRWLERTLDTLEQIGPDQPSPAKQAVELYLRGDETELLKLLMEDYDPGDELSRRLFDRLVTQRNERMARRIQALLAARPDQSIFFAVGAGHLAGEDGVVARLRSAGFEVSRCTPGE
jgi:uncharacterized protein